jgi:hypothetical protein
MRKTESKGREDDRLGSGEGGKIEDEKVGSWEVRKLKAQSLKLAR